MKTAEDAFKELRQSVLELRLCIRETMPNFSSRFIFCLYLIAILMFYGMAIHQITIGNPFDAIIYSIAGLYLSFRL